MKGKNHLITGLIFIVLVFAVDLFLGLKIYSLLNNLDAIVVFSIFYLFFAGILLPDADKFGSWIFKFFFPFAIISWTLGLLISTTQGKKFKHRGFLHTPAGIIVTSLSSSITLFLVLKIFMNIESIILLVFFLATTTGQIIHLIFD